MHTWLLILTLLVFTFSSCKERQSIDSGAIKQGRMEFTVVLTEPGSEGPTDAGQKVLDRIWLRGDFAIEESVSIRTTIDAKNNVKHEYPVQFYRFNDLKNKTIYQYYTFTDTAACIKKYSFYDTTVMTVGGWDFIQKKNHNIVQVNYGKTDTLIDGVMYKQARARCLERGYTTYRLFYFRCGKEIEHFTLDDTLSKQTGCPVTLTYYTDSTFTRKPILMAKVDFVADTLSKKENQIFDIWEKYAKAHPVNR
jgi:hypothetical protein